MHTLTLIWKTHDASRVPALLDSRLSPVVEILAEHSGVALLLLGLKPLLRRLVGVHVHWFSILRFTKLVLKLKVLCGSPKK